MSGDWLPPVAEPDAPAAPATPPASEEARTQVGPTAQYLSRVGAAVVDFFVRLAILLGVFLLVTLGGATGTSAADITTIVGGIFAYAYAPIMIARTRGETVGHRSTSTRIVRRDGTPLDGSAALMREVVVKGILFEGLAIFLAFVPTLLNYLWPLWDEHDECLHDKLCKTRVVDA